MRFTKITPRTLALVLLAVFASLALYRGVRAPVALTTAQSEPASVVEDAGADADAATDAATDAGVAGMDAEPLCLSEVMARLEPHERWLATFEGTPAADTQRPPKLGTLAGLPALPPGQLAFVRSGQIFAVDLPGGAERAVTRGAQDSSPSWSPRGTHLALVRKEKDDGFVYLVRSDGTELRKLSRVPASHPLSFSADGRYLAFPAADHDVVLHDLDTGTEQRLPTPDRVMAGPVFEPSGSRLAMTVFAEGGSVLVADAATGRVERHELPSQHRISSIAFVPGALLLAMSMSTDPGDASSVWRLSLDLEGKLDSEYMPEPMVGAGLELAPAPGGSRIALVNNSLARGEIRSPEGNAEVAFGDWYRREIAFYDRRNPWKGRVVRGFPQPRFSTTLPAWAPDGRHLAFVVELRSKPDDSDPLARGIVAVDTKSSSLAPSFVACGDKPAWGPPASSSAGVEHSNARP